MPSFALSSSTRSACSVAASYKPPMLVTRVRLPACAVIPIARLLKIMETCKASPYLRAPFASVSQALEAPRACAPGGRQRRRRSGQRSGRPAPRHRFEPRRLFSFLSGRLPDSAGVVIAFWVACLGVPVLARGRRLARRARSCRRQDPKVCPKTFRPF